MKAIKISYNPTARATTKVIVKSVIVLLADRRVSDEYTATYLVPHLKKHVTIVNGRADAISIGGFVAVYDAARCNGLPGRSF
jgi:hypothetical protein